jgi:hypothetical protein
MLEREILLVRDAGDDGSSAIEDPGTGTPLGSVRPTARRGWLPLPPVLEVREADDAPLVFTVRRAWSFAPRFEVRDAEGRPIGQLAGPMVADGGGRTVALLGGDGAFRSRDGTMLARVRRARHGTEIHFADAPGTDPFARMLLLAAVLRNG